MKTKGVKKGTQRTRVLYKLYSTAQSIKVAQWLLMPLAWLLDRSYSETALYPQSLVQGVRAVAGVDPS